MDEANGGFLAEISADIGALLEDFRRMGHEEIDHCEPTLVFKTDR
jgi:hypothetical protein